MTPFWRRKPLHERLAEEGGLGPPVAGDHRSPWEQLVGVHGLSRPRQWDAVVAADAPELEGDAVHFAALPDGTLIVDEDVPDGSLAPLADAVEEIVSAPYRAEGVRRGETVWAVAARRIDVLELAEDPGGDAIELTIHDGERTVLVDGARVFGSIRELEELVGGDGVVRAVRLDGALFEVEAAPL